MPTTLAASQAIVKTRYQKGRLPQALYARMKAKFYTMIEKAEDFTGSPWHLAIQNELPQNAGADFTKAQAVDGQGTYSAFDITSTTYYSLARITGQALIMVQGNEGAMIDLWKNECDGAALTCVHDLEVYLHGNGTGVRATASSGGTTTVITLDAPEKAARFFLGMRLEVVDSATSLSPTITDGGASAVITAIDRVAGTITAAVAWNNAAAFGADVSGKFLCRRGTAASGGSPNVIMGFRGYVVGGTTPGTLYGLNRNTDPVRLAGQTFDATGLSMEDAIVDGSSLVAQQGGYQPDLAFMNPRDFAQLRKELSAKVTYMRTSLDVKEAGVSFTAVVVSGDEGDIACVPVPWVERGVVELCRKDSWTLKSAGAAPQLLDWDSNTFLRVTDKDVYECRFGLYGNAGCHSPFSNVIITNYGL